MAVCSIGINDGKYPSRIGKEKTLEYSHWQKMLTRCVKSSSKENKTYINCKVSENFKSYSYFYEWCQKQIGFNNKNYHLDKDLFLKGNNIYSEDYCFFVPMEINNMILSAKSSRGEFPIGVSFDKRVGKFEAYLTKERKKVSLGFYSDPIKAFNAYKVEKEKYIKYMAEKYKDQIDKRLYTALMNRVVDIND